VKSIIRLAREPSKPDNVFDISPTKMLSMRPRTTGNETFAPDGQLDSLDGVVQRITYSNEESGYVIARFKLPKQKQLATIAGNLPGITVGEGLRLEGRWITHPQYGRQFSVSRYQTAAPGSVPALKRYLGSGLLKGVGPVMAEHIVNTFGLDTLEILDAHPERLAEVPGMGARKAQQIAETWRDRRALQNLMHFLQGEGLPVALAVRILRKYGTGAEAIVRQQPYRLSAEVYGVEFQVADAIAARNGVAHDALQRIGAGVAHTLREATSSGHIYLPTEKVITAAARLLDLSPGALRATLPALTDGGFIEMPEATEAITSNPPVYLPELLAAERSVASSLSALQQAGMDRLSVAARIDWERAWAFLDKHETVLMTEAQRDAIRTSLTERVAVLTGGPGTGKTTTLRGIVRLAQKQQASVVLAAPTGRAAKRLTEATGVAATTIHRLLDLRPNGGYEVKTPLEADLVIVDEASMMDLLLADALFKAVPRGSHLLLVGDADQLPPVGPGAAFRDIIASGVVPVVSLETIFRQAEGSAIVSNAHRINHGQVPLIGKEITDFFFFTQREPQACADLIVDLATSRVPNRFGLDPINDIQVLAPIYGGVCGIDALNTRLQATLNPPDPAKDERRFGSRIFRTGDKVMQVVNDYDRQVSNGELGRIVRIDPEEQEVSVSFDTDVAATYTFQDLDELTHAYAISVHKAQGSEYPVVIMPVIGQHARMLERNLLYTSVSRARSLVVLAGAPEALKHAVTTSTSNSRYTNLVEQLRRELA
jgi:exodeoxyribonuclease V alpha subunit